MQQKKLEQNSIGGLFSSAGRTKIDFRPPGGRKPIFIRPADENSFRHANLDENENLTFHTILTTGKTKLFSSNQQTKIFNFRPPGRRKLFFVCWFDENFYFRLLVGRKLIFVCPADDYVPDL